MYYIYDSNEFPELDLEKYVSFFFLRQGAFLNGKPVTEKVFCHSKIMIVDDTVALVTSANFVIIFILFIILILLFFRMIDRF